MYYVLIFCMFFAFGCAEPDRSCSVGAIATSDSSLRTVVTPIDTWRSPVSTLDQRLEAVVKLVPVGTNVLGAMAILGKEGRLGRYFGVNEGTGNAFNQWAL